MSYLLSACKMMTAREVLEISRQMKEDPSVLRRLDLQLKENFKNVKRAS
ncbi:hypothetical protein LC087_19120 (plasmid) [Bacillus carboniphilus]|uniref:Uncharacterized protein n=1 Tax=Bacillus carboniphilus TaxID=86663 RepID=A0ABY9K3P9_9BACI|nr:hypothetical protein [Bacillus carboniphilus]WLR44420.1 hypothetical protein LC087_19120 [Bacillus carboniphilus]